MDTVKKMLTPLAEAIMMIEGDVIDQSRAYRTIRGAFLKTIEIVRNSEHFDEDSKDDLVEVNSYGVFQAYLV